MFRYDKIDHRLRGFRYRTFSMVRSADCRRLLHWSKNLNFSSLINLFSSKILIVFYQKLKQNFWSFVRKNFCFHWNFFYKFRFHSSLGTTKHYHILGENLVEHFGYLGNTIHDLISCFFIFEFILNELPSAQWQVFVFCPEASASQLRYLSHC